MKTAIALTLLLACTFAHADAASDSIKKQQAAVSSASAAVVRANSDALSEYVAIGAQIYGVPATREAVMAARKAQVAAKNPPTLATNGFADDAQLQGLDAKTISYNKSAAAAQTTYHNACPAMDATCLDAARAKWTTALISAGHFCFNQPTVATIVAARVAALAAGTGCKP